MSPRMATFLMFVVHGVVFGTWVASIPGVKSSLDASGAMFGLALMTAWLGALLAQQSRASCWSVSPADVC